MTDIEEAFVLTIKIGVPGFGRKEHQRKMASNVKRILETGLHTRIGMEVLDNVDGSPAWVPIEREDRNAKQARGEEVKDE